MFFVRIRSLGKIYPRNWGISGGALTRGFHAHSKKNAITQFVMPSMSPTMTEGSVAKWLVKEGQSFSQGDVLLEIETDKAQIEVEAPEDGIMAKILNEAGSGKVPVGHLIALTVEEGDDLSNITIPDTTTKSSEKPTEEASAPPSSSITAKPVSSGKRSSHLSPAVSYLVSNYGIKDPSEIPFTGPHGRLLKGDVLSYISSKGLSRIQPKAPTPITSSTSNAESLSKSPSTSFIDIPTTNMRRVIAQRLGESKSTVPHSYTSKKISMDNVNLLRKSLKESNSIRVSVNDFIIRACSLALRDVPEANVRYNPKIDDGVEFISDIDISVAVATPTGLITPIIKNAEQKGIKGISEEIKDLASRAKINKLKPAEYQGGSFSISNLGMFGIKDFTAIINPPQACILAVSGAQEVLVPTAPVAAADILDELSSLPTPAGLISSIEKATSTFTPSISSLDILDELIASPAGTTPLPASLQSKQVMTVTLSSDERVVNGKVAADLLSRIEFYLTNPQNMIL